MPRTKDGDWRGLRWLGNDHPFVRHGRRKLQEGVMGLKLEHNTKVSMLYFYRLGIYS